MNKKFAYILLSLSIFVLIFLNLAIIQKNIPNNIKKLIPWKIVEYFYEVKNLSNAMQNYNYLYNALFLPETQYASFDLDKKNIFANNEKIENKKIFLSKNNNTIFLTTNDGEIYFYNLENLSNKKTIIAEIKKNNLNSIFDNKIEILDIFNDKKFFYVSVVFDENLINNKKCKKFSILRSSIKPLFKFEKIFSNNKCALHQIVGGRMQKIQEKDNEYLIFSLSDVSNDQINQDPQKKDNYYGKINYINLKNFSSGFYSYGHRNPQGLNVFNNKILSTEHGPRGGDEINLIEKNKNYGWPIASYGKSYFTNEIKYKKNHVKSGYQEPIFSFVSAIGISELIKLPNNFIKNYEFQNLYFISSLFGRSLFLTNFDENLQRVIFIEKIYIGNRIRDLIYLDNQNYVLLSLENPTQIAILKQNDD